MIRMITLAISNQKGGAGKSATAAALAGLLPGCGLQVLVVDLDPQGTLTNHLGIDPAGRSLAEVIGGPEPGPLALRAILREVKPGLTLAPSSPGLSSCELGLVMRLGRESVLRAALAGLGNQFDLCLIDCGPSMGLLTVNALVASNAVIIPTMPTVADLHGVTLLLSSIEKVRVINPGLGIMGVVVTQFDQRATAHREVINMIESAGLRVLAIIPRSVRVQEAAGLRQLLPDYDPAGKATIAYKDLTGVVFKWLKDQYSTTR